MIHEKLIELTIQALKNGHKLDDVKDFIDLLSRIDMNHSEIKTLEFGSGTIE